MTFRQTIKKFFEPVLQKETKGYYIVAIIFAIFWSFYEVFSVIILEKISFFVESRNISQIYTRILIFFVSAILYFIYRIIFRETL